MLGSGFLLYIVSDSGFLRSGLLRTGKLRSAAISSAHFPGKNAAHFGSTVPGKTQHILEVLFPEKRSAFWKYCSRKKANL
jgi:hypothetical protein